MKLSIGLVAYSTRCDQSHPLYTSVLPKQMFIDARRLQR